MKLVVGIGNPEAKYRNNRHNVGHMVVDELQPATRIKGLVIKKSESFMNESGSFVKKMLSKYSSVKVSDLYVIHDDLDIPLGAFKIQFGKGPKEHKGLVSIYEALGTRDFWHVRVGIENRQQALGTRIKGEQYVLEDFSSEERNVLGGVVKQICNQLVS